MHPFHPMFYLALYIGFLFVRPQEYPGVRIEFPIMPVLLAVAVVLSLIRPSNQHRPPVGALLAGLCVAVPASVAAGGWLGGAWKAFLAFTPTALLAFAAMRSIDTLPRLKALLAMLVAVMAFLAVHGIDQAGQGIGWSGATMIAERIRYIGILGDPNDVASALLFALPLAIHFAVSPASGLTSRVLGIAAIPALLWATYLTSSRGAVVSLIAMIGAFVMVRRQFSRAALVAPLMVLGVLSFAPARFTTGGDSEDASSEGRIEAWYVGMQMFQAHPVFGSGYGTFLDHHERTAHNSFVLAFAELGLFGYFFWFSLVALSCVMLYRCATVGDPLPDTDASRARELRDARALARALLYAMVGLVVSSFFLSRTYIPINYLAMGVTVAMFGIHRSLDPRVAGIALHEWAPRLAAMTVGSFAVFWLAVRIGTVRFA